MLIGKQANRILLVLFFGVLSVSHDKYYTMPVLSKDSIPFSISGRLHSED